jgi:hypothetical protein
MEVKDMDEVYMDVDAVRNMATQFQNISDILKQVCQALEVLSNMLKATAFIGLVGGAVMLQFIEFIKPHIEDISEKCAEIHTDLNDAAEAFVRGDQAGALRFH